MPLVPEHRERGEDEHGRERVREVEGGEGQHHRADAQRECRGRAEPGLEAIGDAPDEQQEDHRGQERAPEVEVPELPGWILDRLCPIDSLPGEVGQEGFERQAGRLCGVVVAVDLRDVAGPAVTDLESRPVDPRRPVGEGPHERVVGGLVPADLGSGDRVRDRVTYC